MVLQKVTQRYSILYKILIYSFQGLHVQIINGLWVILCESHKTAEEVGVPVWYTLR